jgi:ferredoxin
MTSIQLQLQQKAKELLIEKQVNVIIGYGKIETDAVGAVFVRDPSEVDRLLWNNQCAVNLAGYLKRKEIKQLGKPAIVVKGCDAKTLAVLEIEKQLDREKIVVIGVECTGIQYRRPNTRQEDKTLQEKCLSCNVQQPPHCDIVIAAPNQPDSTANPPHSQPSHSTNRYARLNQLTAMSPNERFEFWKNEFSRCIKCYACRQNCPLCYCDVCVTDKNRPVRIETSATLRGNFAWNILRAFHLAGRCVGCAACSTACPVGIDLDLLNLSLSKAAEEIFNYQPGAERHTNPLIGTFSPEDHESFIR